MKAKPAGLLITLITCLDVVPPASAGDVADDGKRFYEHGEETIQVRLEGPGIERPSTAFACINCHGVDGRGGREGGVDVPAITWRYLAAPGNNRPAYDRGSFKKALEEGIDPDGRVLHATMPRYRMDQETVRALLAYLEVIGRQEPAGVSADTIKLATIIPGDGRLFDAAKAAAGVMQTIMASANQAGGVYGRSIEFDVLSDPSALPDKLFALVGRMTSLTGTTPQALDLFPLNQDRGSDVREVKFELLPSLEDQARLMIREIASVHDRAMLIIAEDDRYRRAADAAEREAASIAGFSLERLDLDTDDPGALFQKAGKQPLLYLADGSPLAQYTALKQPLRIWTSVDLIAPMLPDLIDKPGLFLTLLNPHPPAPSDHDRRRQFEAIIQQHGHQERHRGIAALAAAAAFATIDCLRAAGRRLTRTSFDAACSTIPAIETGLTSPILPGRSWATDAMQWLEINGSTKQRGAEKG
ncbi:MAG: cytochrome c/ABC transporter substrate-binding protein [Geminicoccaceae bacterium]